MKSITGNTRLLGILADPIHHVKTPERINHLLGSIEIDAVMMPIHVAQRNLEAVVRGLRCIQNLDGFVVTVPHKIAMLALCDELTSAAAQIGAVNVVRRMPDGLLIGGMLDGEGFVAGLRKEGVEPSGRSVYLAGAGGAASAVAFALAHAGVSQLMIANRNGGKAQQLIDRIAGVYPNLHLAFGSGDPSGHDIVVNGTSLGMRADDPLPLDADRLSPAQRVVDIIMQPAETPLLQAAKSRGCAVHYGAAMLAGQLELMAAFMGVLVPRDAGSPHGQS